MTTLALDVRLRPARTDLRAAAVVGLYAGVLSAFVKLGWEVLLPPRTSDRVEPPLLMLEKLGLPANDWTFTFSGSQVNWASLAVHFLFSVATVVAYCLLVEYFPGVSLGAGVAYGVAIFVMFHLVVLPALTLSPAPWDLPFDEWVSELLGHAVWLFSAELIRRSARPRTPVVLAA